MEGFEPSSKRGINRLSTCLVIDLVFELQQAHDNQLQPYPLNFGLRIEALHVLFPIFSAPPCPNVSGRGNGGDVSSTPLWRGLSDSTVLQIKQRERSCYFRQL